MTKRIERKEFYNIAPAVTQGLLAVDKAIEESGLEKELLELIKLRASQINGCAFCISYHMQTARKLGMEQYKLDLISVWHDAGVFSERETAALLYTETLTKVSKKGVPDDVYSTVQKNFSEKEIAFLTAAISAINAWNRMSVAFQYAPLVAKG